MATRFTAKPTNNFGVPPLPSGFQNVSIPDNLTIPPVGIEDVDRALFNLFNSELTLSVTSPDGIKRVPVMFASGEKWAMLKKGRALRDKTGSLILPLITIGRNNIQQTPSEDQAGRGINQQTGELVIKRRLNEGDRAYQQLINRLLIKNQTNLAANPDDATVLNQITTGRALGDLKDDPTVSLGGLLVENRLNNVVEVITIPSPQFFTATYEVTIWTQYTEHMNQVLEGLIASFLPQGNAWRLETNKGYWFVATVDGNLYTPENNFDDMSSEERIIKYKFSIKVPAYILASAAPGTPVPIRRYISNPSIDFTVAESGVPDGIDDPYLGSDDPTLPLSDDPTKDPDQRWTGKTRLYPGNSKTSSQDPALASLPRGTSPAQYRKFSGVDSKGRPVVRYARIKNVNKATGETTFSSMDLSDMSIIVVDD